MELIPEVGTIIQIDPENKEYGGGIFLVKDIDHDIDSVVAVLIEPSKKGSYSRLFKIPIQDCEIVGSPMWLPEDIKPRETKVKKTRSKN